MHCRACGQNFCWHCRRPNHSGGDMRCKLMSLHEAEQWGNTTTVRVATKTLAVPCGLAVGGVAVGAAGESIIQAFMQSVMYVL